MENFRRAQLYLAVVSLALWWAPTAYSGEETSENDSFQVMTSVELEYLGSQTCETCHDNVAPALALTAHGSEGFSGRTDLGCEACHGPAGAHLEDPEAPFSFSNWTAQQSGNACASCHSTDSSHFPSNAHARVGLACIDCHSIHGATGWAALDEGSTPPQPAAFGTARITGSSAACVQCHSDVAGEFYFNERHRLQEGIIGCADCHDPHGPSTRTRLAGFKQESCVDCHADKGGPFVFEHGSVRVEGCAACHSPHGSPNRHMLTHQRVAELCYSCHVEVPGFHISGGRFDQNTQCTNCHSAIHGSNFSPVFFK